MSTAGTFGGHRRGDPGYRRASLALFAAGVATFAAVFLVYPLGSLSSALAGRLAERFGRRRVLPCGVLVAFVVALRLRATPPLRATATA